MTRLLRSVMILVIIILIIAGLNTSNQGNNILTAEARKSVFSIKIVDKNLEVVALGEEYTYSGRELIQDNRQAIYKAQKLLHSISNYFKRIWTIFKVLVLE
ncbi:Uncharacterized [Syntrophomonas zehnderi OL-4]|uniref:Uncharacterized n=1 Tax=Syntrophomonas zehnderi OL-4 TaxID=690567 RepID=A0A0E4GCP6_9FIRM|nr:hypothetical protein [Syntrophomonas zehnderi]CFY02939.1 Uncharacterized [Syntrophomonas zehnderi OL-4]